MNRPTAILDLVSSGYSTSITCDACGNITQVEEVKIVNSEEAELTTTFGYDDLNRLTYHQTQHYEVSGVPPATTTYYKRRDHKYDALGRVAQSALTEWTGNSISAPTYKDHVYAGSRHVQNVAGMIHGEVWHWAGAAHEHAAPLKSPNADTANNYGYNIANNASPQREVDPKNWTGS